MESLLLILIIAAMFSCSDRKEINEKRVDNSDLSPSKNTETDSFNFHLDSFVNIPKEIDGCGCYFYLSKQDEKDEKYIFVSDFANIAFISVNSRLERFDLKEHEAGSTVYQYLSGEYKLEVEFAKKDAIGSETSILEGIIRLYKGSNVVQKDFTGSCGC